MAQVPDDTLAYLQSFNQSIRGAGADLADLRKKLEYQQTLEQLPGMLNAGQFNEAAVKLASVNEVAPLREMFQSYTAKQKAMATPAKPVLGVSDIQNLYPGIASTQAEVIAKLPESAQQLTALGGVRSTETARANQKAIDADRDEQRGVRKEETVQRQREKFTADFNKRLETYQAAEKQAAQVEAAFAQGTAPGDALMFNFLARVLGGEKGPLSEGDVGRFQSEAFERDVNKQASYLAGGGNIKMTDKQRQAFNDLFAVYKEKLPSWKNEQVGGVLAQARGTSPKLFEGGLDDSIAEAAARAGYKPQKKGDRYEFTTGETKTTVPGQVRNDGGDVIDVTSLYTMANSIPDPVRKKQALDALQAKPPQDPAKFKAWQERLKQFGAK